jgi:hypothetical protein
MRIRGAFARLSWFIGVLLVSISLLGCGKSRGLDEMTKIEQRWKDGVNLAGSTARMALAPQVANLQSIRRDLDGVEVSDCLKEAKAILANSMELTIQGFMQFLANENGYGGLVSQKSFQEAGEKLEAYKPAKDKCIQ